MFNTAKSFGKFLVTPQPQTNLTLGINLTVAAVVTVGMVRDFAGDIRQIKHEEQMARDCAK